MIKCLYYTNPSRKYNSQFLFTFGINDASVVSSLRTMQVFFEWYVWMQNKNSRDVVLVRPWHTVLTWPGEKQSQRGSFP